MSKTVIEMAREVYGQHTEWTDSQLERLKQLEALIRADEKEACANLVFHSPPSDEYESPLMAVYNAIRARGQG